MTVRTPRVEPESPPVMNIPDSIDHGPENAPTGQPPKEQPREVLNEEVPSLAGN
jgi:hypothetical protein